MRGFESLLISVGVLLRREEFSGHVFVIAMEAHGRVELASENLFDHLYEDNDGAEEAAPCVSMPSNLALC